MEFRWSWNRQTNLANVSALGLTVPTQPFPRRHILNGVSRHTGRMGKRQSVICVSGHLSEVLRYKNCCAPSPIAFDGFALPKRLEL